MSRDLTTSELGLLEDGCHRARNAQNGQELREAHEPLFSTSAFMFFLTLGLAAVSGFVIWWAMGGTL